MQCHADTALYIFVRGAEGEWEAPVAASQSHLEGAELGLPHIAEPLSGPNDTKEQA